MTPEVSRKAARLLNVPPLHGSTIEARQRFTNAVRGRTNPNGLEQLAEMYADADQVQRAAANRVKVVRASLRRRE